MTQLENNLKSLDYLKNFDDADLTEALRRSSLKIKLKIYGENL